MTPAKLAKLVEQFERAEADLVRTMSRWNKLRGQVRRAEKSLQKEFAKRAESGDWRTLADAEFDAEACKFVGKSGDGFDDDVPF